MIFALAACKFAKVKIIVVNATTVVTFATKAIVKAAIIVSVAIVKATILQPLQKLLQVLQLNCSLNNFIFFSVERQ